VLEFRGRGGTLENTAFPDICADRQGVEIASSAKRARWNSAHKMASRTANIKPATSSTHAQTDVKVTAYIRRRADIQRRLDQISAIARPLIHMFAAAHVKEHPPRPPTKPHREQIYSMGVVMYHLLAGRASLPEPSNTFTNYQPGSTQITPTIRSPASALVPIPAGDPGCH